MLSRLILLLILTIFLLPLGAGCMTNRPYIWSWPHNKRRIMTTMDGWHEFHMDFDRILFDMDERPLEDVD